MERAPPEYKGIVNTHTLANCGHTAGALCYFETQIVLKTKLTRKNSTADPYQN